MPAIDFKLPRGAILFTDDAYAYEFREDLGEAHHGLSLFVARRRTLEGNHPRGKVLLKAVGRPTVEEGARVKRARAKLEEQVRLATYLQHPGILRVHGLRKTEGAWYVITEHPSGQTLNDLLTVVSECRRWFSPLFALYVGAQVASALEHAHMAKDEKGNPLGIVHRAIDLDHVFMDWDGTVQVADFGLALSNLPGRVASTVARPQADTYFASPEMLLSGRVDARSDLYTLGLVMLELATGKNLLHAPDDDFEEAKGALSRRKLARVKRAIRRALLAGCSPAMEAVIWRAATYTPEDVDAATASLPELLRVPLCKMLQREPAARYQTAGELAADLCRWHGVAYGKGDAAAELKSVAKDAGEALVELDLRGPRGHGRALDDITTR
ncbi:protein kinase [Pyxidicoccus fallax]|uniref:Protein kinase n=1 Tax=Pyxidicoccus fallax TaxID=394095 RepID=A0A848LID4_9BACT|nr:protein kinase [Pyxidicoccus fallax]NMO17483.1 protein kinase [Pyxidicoccus fallax]NPC77722.1 protein kinase [Pyxidicoccus fallax]